MLRRNLDVSKGLVNGSMGTITGFEWENLRREPLAIGEIPHCVLVCFDDDKIAQKVADSKNGSVKIKPVNIKFQGKSGKTIVRRMIPLILSWAVTVHKMQGATLNKVVVDLFGGFDYAMEYVSLSRVKCIEGLAISKLKIARFTNNKFTCPKALKELDRQRNKKKEI